MVIIAGNASSVSLGKHTARLWSSNGHDMARGARGGACGNVCRRASFETFKDTEAQLAIQTYEARGPFNFSTPDAVGVAYELKLHSHYVQDNSECPMRLAQSACEDKS